MSSSALNTSYDNPIRIPHTSISRNASNHTTTPQNEPLHASRDCRKLVRLAQCSQCSRTLELPVTLPCGHTICKRCIPELHIRPHISYPVDINRHQGFTCPLEICGKDHAITDCSLDVVLDRVFDAAYRLMESYMSSEEARRVLLDLTEINSREAAGHSTLEEPPQTQVLPGGKLAAAYYMAKNGALPYYSEVSFNAPSATVLEAAENLDQMLLENIKEIVRPELECHLCYALFLDPFTTSCGHTLCRQCLHRVQDHSSNCPTCRRALPLPPGVTATQAPSNILLEKIISGLYPGELESRKDAAEKEEKMVDLDTPLFVCALSFPNTPTFLHVFEPRYRLMMRRAIAKGDRKFGMLMHNPERQVQGDLGRVPFYQYGTMLRIIDMHVLRDGRSIVETIGIYRFRVLRHGVLDGYTVGKVEKITDMPVPEEEAIEAAETSGSSLNQRGGYLEDEFIVSSRASGSTSLPNLPNFDTYSTQELIDYGINFVKQMRMSSASWLHQSVVDAYGPCPDDAENFPWWFASVIPVSEEEKYKMLFTTSVRQRLKMCAMFATQLELQKWCANSHYTSSDIPLSYQ